MTTQSQRIELAKQALGFNWVCHKHSTFVPKEKRTLEETTVLRHSVLLNEVFQQAKKMGRL